MSEPFARHGPAEPESPVVLSVPHAGREYPAAMRGMARLAPPRLHVLEDRLVDAVALAARERETTLVALRPRAWIDLNRGEDERDPLIDEGAPPAATSHRLRSGLGLVPRRAGAAGDVWRRRLSDAEVRARIEEDHRPYHRELARLLAAARARFGMAVLLDIHSMPPLTSAGAPQIVLGDRFGSAAAPGLVARLEQAVEEAGYRVALNSPYAGGHVVATQASVAERIHAVQVEIDRRLYLDQRLDRLGTGLGETARLLRRLIDVAADEVLPRTLAAE